MVAQEKTADAKGARRASPIGLLTVCSEAASPRDFVERLTSWLAEVYEHDDALALFYDSSKTIVGFYTFKTPEGWLESFLSYYADYPERIYSGTIGTSALKQERIGSGAPLRIDMYDWTCVGDSPFKRNHIDSSGLKSTLTFNLYDMSNTYRVAICLNRRVIFPQKSEELELLRVTLPILNGMYRNFLYKETEEKASPWGDYGLTAREAEIANMLCRGMKPAQIGDELYIARNTVRKHVAHIYEKVGVSSQAELIVRAVENRDMF
ncbi:MAG: helix-turn-helix transcriptional regulator [Coriobacteriaceae bacterium]|nr:helix-turn-helix transcriptional regulator [Coriobacteriaceae bacterium]